MAYSYWDASFGRSCTSADSWKRLPSEPAAVAAGHLRLLGPLERLANAAVDVAVDAAVGRRQEEGETSMRGHRRQQQAQEQGSGVVDVDIAPIAAAFVPVARAAALAIG